MTVELERAEAFLQEAVYRSRARQAAGVALAQAATDKQRQCGLGARAELELDLSPRAAELARELWPTGVDEARAELLRRTLSAWIERQDALDRDRNHFLKAFRNEHGFDRSAYAPEQLAKFEAGLERINAQANTERTQAARRLLA